MDPKQKVKTHILAPLETYYGRGEFESAEQAAFVASKWCEHLGIFSESVLQQAFDQVILLNRFHRWPTLAEVYGICCRLAGRDPERALRGERKSNVITL